MKRIAGALLGFLFLLAMSGLPVAEATERVKASVVVTFIDRATKGEEGKAWINERIRSFLDGKVAGIYDLVSGARFEPQMKALNLDKGVDEKTLFALLGESGADYALLAELVSAKESGSMGLFRSSKNANIELDIKILDLVNGGYLKQGRFTGKSVDDNAVVSIEDRLVAVFVINSREISEKALDKLLFQAGEVISVNLPLGKPAKR